MPRASKHELPVEQIEGYQGRMTQMAEYNVAFESMPADFHRTSGRSDEAGRLLEGMNHTRLPGALWR